MNKEFLSEYLNVVAPTGSEENAQKVWMEYIKSKNISVRMDRMNNAIASTGSGNFSVAMVAHADEICWMVKYIDDKGFIYVIGCGADEKIALSRRVCILTRKGIVKGVFGLSACHIREDDDDDNAKKDCVSDLYVDVGCDSKKEAEKLGIRQGDYIVYDDKMEILNEKYLIGRALDDRIGGFVIAETLKRISEMKINKRVYAINSSQEEVGSYGAKCVIYDVNPSAIICIDVTHETNIPQIKKEKLGDIDFNSCVLAINPLSDKKFIAYIEQIAKKNKIKLQTEANSHFTGTDMDEMALIRNGIPSVLISIPLRYMHTTVEMVKLKTVSDAINLLTHIITGEIEKN